MRISTTDQTGNPANSTPQPATAPPDPLNETSLSDFSPLGRTLEALVQFGTPPKLPEGFASSPRAWFMKREIKDALGKGDLPRAIKCILGSGEPMLALSALRWAEDAEQPALAGELVRAFVQRGNADAVEQLLARANQVELTQKAVAWAALAGNNEMMQQILPAALDGADRQTICELVRSIDQPACRDAVLRWAHNHHREDVLLALTGQPRAARTTPPPNAAVDEAWVKKTAQWAQTACSQDIRALLRETVRRGETHGVMLTLRAIPRPELAPNALLWAHEFGHVDLRDALIPAVLHTRDADAALWLVTTVGGTDIAEEVHLWAIQSGRSDIASKIAEYLVRWAPQPTLLAGAEQDIGVLTEWAQHSEAGEVMRRLNQAIGTDDARGTAVILQAAARPVLNREALLLAASQGRIELLCALIPTALAGAEDNFVIDIVRSANLKPFAMAVFDWAKRAGNEELAARAIKFTTPFDNHDAARGAMIEQLLINLISANDPSTVLQLVRESRDLLDAPALDTPTAHPRNEAALLAKLQESIYQTRDDALRITKSAAAVELLFACTTDQSSQRIFDFALQAARMGDLVTLARMDIAGLNLDAKNEHGFTPLHRLAHDADVAAMDALVSAGANINQAGAGGYTALHIAAGRGDLRATEFLLHHGASRRARTDKADGALTAFQVADTLGHYSVARLLRGLRLTPKKPPRGDAAAIRNRLCFAGGLTATAPAFATAPPSAAQEWQT